jgi:hypothetical protein
MSKQNILTPEIASQIGGAIAELQVMNEIRIVTQESEAKKAGLQSFLNRALAEHADELIASWFAVHLEYEPLIHGFVGLMSRSSGILQKRAEHMAKQAEGTK